MKLRCSLEGSLFHHIPSWESLGIAWLCRIGRPEAVAVQTIDLVSAGSPAHLGGSTGEDDLQGLWLAEMRDSRGGYA